MQGLLNRNINRIKTLHVSLNISDTFIFFPGGWNTNPSCAEFSAAIKRLLFRCGVSAGPSGNVQPQDGTEMLQNINDISEQDEIPSTSQLSLYVDDTVQYMAGWISRQLQCRLKCMDCALALTSAGPSLDENSLLSIKDNGGLIYPSVSVVRICKKAETLIRAKRKWSKEFIPSALMALQGMNLFPNLNEHHLNTLDGVDSHVTSIIRLILWKYFNVRQHHVSKLQNLELHRRRMRSSYNTLLHRHYNQ